MTRVGSIFLDPVARAYLLLVAVDGELAGIVNLKDTIKESSATAIARLKELGLRPTLLTGDNGAVAAQVAAAVGIAAEDVFADVLPEGKVEALPMLDVAGAQFHQWVMKPSVD